MPQIPKTIHYCWFGKADKPESVCKYINTWKKYCPDYKIIEWNEDNFDITSNTYVNQAYQQKKYAFVTDYVRLYVLYNYGGIYMDTDVEVLKPLDKFLNNSAFSGFENNNNIPTGIMGAEKGNLWIKDLLDEYNDLVFIKENGTLDLTTNVVRITNLTKKKYGLKQESSFQNLKNIVTLYPYDYFCPKDWETGEIHCTQNTYTIHHFSGSWHGDKEKKQAEKYRKRLKKYISKYGEGKGKLRLNQVDLIKYYLCHPIKLIKKTILKIKGDLS